MTKIQDISEALEDNDFAYIITKLDEMKGSYAALVLLQAMHRSGETVKSTEIGLRRAINTKDL